MSFFNTLCHVLILNAMEIIRNMHPKFLMHFKCKYYGKDV